MNIILFDTPETRTNLMPFSLTRAISDLRIGIFKLSEKWQNLSNGTISYLTEDYLSKKFQTNYCSQNYYINAAWIPSKESFLNIIVLENDKSLYYKNQLIALKSNKKYTFDEINNICDRDKIVLDNINMLENSYQIFQQNASQIEADFDYISNVYNTEFIIDDHTKCYNINQIFVENGVKTYAAILNATYGPIYIGKDVEIQEGAMIRGPVALCEGAVVNMGAKIRGGVTIGKYSKVGGELSNSVIFDYSNKAHDGFLGNSVIGEWCNLGADSNTSNLKNNYSNVSLYSFKSKKYEDTGLQFCGLMMGDHSKCGINTMFNTGTMVGVYANIFGGNFPPKLIPSFSWGGSDGMVKFEFSKAIEIAKTVLQRRKKVLSDADINMLKYIYDQYNAV